ncbi:MAG: hypothetical protein ACKVPX_15640, partial [Myxococcaceae bacterium]
MSPARAQALSLARDPIAVSTVQDGVRAFATSGGYVPYAQHGNTVLTLGPPVCAPEAMASAAADFLSHFPGATFFYV